VRVLRRRRGDEHGVATDGPPELTQVDAEVVPEGDVPDAEPEVVRGFVERDVSVPTVSGPPWKSPAVMRTTSASMRRRLLKAIGLRPFSEK